MIEGQKFYVIKGLVSKEDIDKIDKELKRTFSSKSSIVFNALKNNGITVYEISVHAASARISTPQMTLDTSGNGESTTKRDFNRFKIENPSSQKDQNQKKVKE